jgi:hypothetical protein
VGSTHFSHDDEMIVRGPILLAGAVVGPDAETLVPFALSFLVDRAEVWEKLAEILLPHDAFTVIKAAKKTQNGRLAYQLLFRHYLGPNNVGKGSTRALRSATCSMGSGARPWMRYGPISCRTKTSARILPAT